MVRVLVVELRTETIYRVAFFRRRKRQSEDLEYFSELMAQRLADLLKIGFACSAGRTPEAAIEEFAREVPTIYEGVWHYHGGMLSRDGIPLFQPSNFETVAPSAW